MLFGLIKLGVPPPKNIEDIFLAPAMRLITVSASILRQLTILFSIPSVWPLFPPDDF